MRKKASFTALLYRELLLCKKSLIVYMVSTLIFTMIPILVILSLRYGNLTMLPEHIVADIRADNDLMLMMSAVIYPCMLVISLAESSVFDTRTKWDSFRRSTPVKPARMALAKYVLLLLLLLVSVTVASAVMVLCHGLLGSPVLKTDIAVIMMLVAIISILTVMAQIFIILLGSVDKGMVAMIVCVAAVIFLVPRKIRTNLSVEGLLNSADKLLPMIPVILMGILLFGFGMTTFIYARREK